MIEKTNIHIFIPVFNEAATIPELIQEIQGLEYTNIYIVDDGSTDEILEKVKHRKVKVIRHFINRGVGAATQTAIEWARKNDIFYMILMDGDGQHLPKDMEKLSSNMEVNKSDLVIGNRFLDDISSMPKTRRLFNRIANLITNFFCSNTYTDTQSGFRMLNRAAIESIQLRIDHYGFCSEMILQAERHRLKISEVAVQTVYTTYSIQKGQSFFKGVETAFELIWRVIFR